MRWLRRWLHASEPPETPPGVAESLAEARAAREESEQAVIEVRGLWPDVYQITDSLREHRRRNNFRSMFERALHGGET